MFTDFRERAGGERVREREKHRCKRETHTPTRDQTHDLGMCPNWELNPQSFGVWDNALTN